MTTMTLDKVNEVMMEVVAEATGYPVEMLNSEMNLEADLGIDSIKRVEILSAFQEKLSTKMEYDANELLALHTIGDITGYFSKKLGN